MGVWSGATDDFDEGLDRPLEIIGYGAVAVYHEADPNVWSGPTDFYVTDYRAALLPMQSQTWSPICFWANPDAYTYDWMYMSFEPAVDLPPPANRDYTLELLYVPEGVEDAPPVGTVWHIPPDDEYMIELPTFRTYDGLEGYRLAFSVGPTVCVADVTGPDGQPDGLTDLADLALLLGSYGLCSGDEGFIPEADLTGGPDGEPDGCVSLADLGFLLSDYGCGT
jgi:hypothetical protein